MRPIVHFEVCLQCLFLLVMVICVAVTPTSIMPEAKQYLDYEFQRLADINSANQELFNADLYLLVVLTSMLQAQTPIPEKHFCAMPLVTYLKAVHVMPSYNGSSEDILQERVFEQYSKQLAKYRDCQKRPACCLRFANERVTIPRSITLMFTDVTHCKAHQSGGHVCRFGQVIERFVQSYVNSSEDDLKHRQLDSYRGRAQFSVTVWPRFWKVHKFVKQIGGKVTSLFAYDEHKSSCNWLAKYSILDISGAITTHFIVGSNANAPLSGQSNSSALTFSRNATHQFVAVSIFFLVSILAATGYGLWRAQKREEEEPEEEKERQVGTLDEDDDGEEEEEEEDDDTNAISDSPVVRATQATVTSNTSLRV